MVFAVLLQFVWMIVTIVLSVAVLYLLLIDRMIDSGVQCVNLKHYGKNQKFDPSPVHMGICGKAFLDIM